MQEKFQNYLEKFSKMSMPLDNGSFAVRGLTPTAHATRSEIRFVNSISGTSGAKSTNTHLVTGYDKNLLTVFWKSTKFVSTDGKLSSSAFVKCSEKGLQM